MWRQSVSRSDLTEAQPGVVHTVSYFCDVLQRQADGTDNSWPLLVTVDPEKQQVRTGR